MDLTTTPTSSPASSPIPIPQGESPCLTRRNFAMEMEVLNLKIISQKSLLGNIQRYPQYEETQLFQIEQNELTILEAKRDQMMAPPKTSESELPAQNEARFFKKQSFNNPPQYNRQGNNTAQPTDLLFILADLLNKYPGLAQQLPRIAAVKNSRNQKYAIIEALLDSESYV
ncbi:hypothetical protein NPIL_637941 [Nephila pilipes]|uniref:Uncharacterized protein n=1 Tax=Nephila pilipes TaxID=299642 RepID=A0A8X6UEE7_NEPPI|nr:hypothetical protein NPIL_637941 [Nephila pilipes]